MAIPVNSGGIPTSACGFLVMAADREVNNLRDSVLPYAPQITRCPIRRKHACSNLAWWK